MVYPSSNKILTTSLIIVGFIITYIFLPPKTPLSPLSHQPTHQPSNNQKSYIILGFLPYWNMSKLSPISLTSITHLAYFTLRLDKFGNLIKLDNPREEEPGYTNYKRLLTSPIKSSSNLILTFMPQDQVALDHLLNNNSSRQQAISTILNLLQTSHAIGLNIDYEPLGYISPEQKNNFTLFIKQLRKQLKPQLYQLSISIYPSSGTNPRIWDLSHLSNLADYFIVMTYDYHLPTQNKAGPNSPLRGAKTLFQNDIITNLAEITQSIPSQKILLGIPFYGYEWDTNTDLKYSFSTNRASLASIDRVRNLINQNSLELIWDRNSLTPYAIRRNDGEIISQIYYENIDSIKLKLALVKSANLGGIAIWALGYEGNYPELWSVIRSLND